MLIPIRYNLRHLVNRWTGTLSTVLTFGLVVGVFVIVMSLAVGLDRAFVSTGDPLNVIVMRAGAQSEVMSFIPADRYQIVRHFRGIAKDAAGDPIVAPEVLRVLSRPRKASGKSASVLLRGIHPQSLKIRPQIQVIEGRMFKPGQREVIASKSVAGRFENYGLGDRPHMGNGTWSVVGLFDAGGTAFASEVWCDYRELMQDFDWGQHSTVILRAEDAVAAEALARQVEEDVRVQLTARTEIELYAGRTRTSAPIKAFGTFLAVLMAIGASFAGMNAMYASVANRTKEIGTLRVLGFKPSSIIVCFVIESVLLALAGGAIGCLVALPMNTITTGAMSFDSFSEIVFEPAVTPGLAGAGLLFAVIMGVAGGLLPAVSAARRPIAEALMKR